MSSKSGQGSSAEQTLEWSETEYRLNDFVSKFTLPQLVRVERGFHGGDEDTALGWGQVLTIHMVRAADTIIGKDTESRNVYIPLTCGQKVEVLSPGRKPYYECVGELCNVFPKYARVTREYQSNKKEQCLHLGDKLTLKRIAKKRTLLECENQNGVHLRLPMSMQARFHPLLDGQEYLLSEVIKSFKLPVAIHFIDSKRGLTTGSKVFNSNLGVLTLQHVMKEESIVCSTKDDSLEKRYVVTIPKAMDITVAAAQGAIMQDQQYASLCDVLNEAVELSKVETLESENVYASRQEIREYMQLQLFRVQSEYAKPTPPRPLPRIALNSNAQNPTTPGSSVKGANNDDDIYESIPEGYRAASRKLPPQVLPATRSVETKLTETEKKDSEPSSVEESTTDNQDEPQTPPPIPSSPKPIEESINVSSLSVDDVADLLAKHRLGNFVETFKYEEIDGNMLRELDTEALKDLGMNNFQAKKLLMLVKGWQPKTDG